MPDPREPTTLGRYRLLGELGRGGMGIVHRAEDTHLGRCVALKVLPEELTRDDRARERFEREARLLAAMNHPNIAVLHSLEREGDRQFLTMELVEGETLDARIERGALTVADTLQVAHQIACALAAAHRKDVVHRDLKPKNVMLTEEDRVKVLDFGLARIAPESTTDETREISFPDALPSGTRALASGDSRSIGTLVGTPGYMSPEQLRGERVDPRTDLFSFGCVLFECLTARRVFGGKSVWERIASTLEREPDLDELPPAVPASLRELIAACLRKSPAERPTTEEVRQRLEKEIERARVGAVTAPSAPPTTADRPSSPVPRRLDALIGRAAEIEEIRATLADEPLVTLTGAGGSGKTRLAIEAAHRFEDDARGTAGWVDLVGVTATDLLPDTIAAALGIEVRGGGSPVEQLTAWFTAEPRLLVLDNCEHLVDACAELVDTLLAPPSESRILATSREALGVDGESAIPVSPLAVPPAEETEDLASLEANPAVALFVTRARSTSRKFALRPGNARAVAEICRRLDGIPLAIELAAARVGVLTPEQIATRLDDRFHVLTKSSRRALPRHRTLRAAVDWSHELLDEDERRVFRRLAVFSGGWNLEAAEEVIWTDDADRLNGLDVLSQLIDKSMVVMRSDELDGARYTFLETMREYATEKLRESGEEEEFRLRHAEYFTGIVTGTVPRGWSTRDTSAHERVDQEVDNLRAILTRGAAGENAALALELTAALGAYWDLRGQWTEGRHFARALLDLPELSASSRARAEVAHWAGKFAQYLGRLEEARTRLRESLTIARTIDEPTHIAAALQTLGNVEEYAGALDASEACYTECRAIYERLGNQPGLAAAIGNLGVIAMDREEYEDGLRYFDEAREIFREIGHLRGVATSLNNSGVIANTIGDFDRAVELVEEALEIRRALDDPLGVASCLHNVGEFEFARGNIERSLEVHAEALGIKHRLGERYYLLQSIESFAEIAARQGEWERGGQLLGAARRTREELGVPCPEPGRSEKEALWEEILAALDDAQRARVDAWAAEATIDAMVERALEGIGGATG